MMSGYLDNASATAETMRSGWLMTGDLGSLIDDRVVVTGRIRETIIAGGRNIAPDELEMAAEEVPGVRPGGVVAFQLSRSEHGSDDVILVAEVGGRSPTAQELKRGISAVVGVAPNRVVLVPKGTVPKTSSGKRQRLLCRALCVDGRLSSTSKTALE